MWDVSIIAVMRLLRRFFPFILIVFFAACSTFAENKNSTPTPARPDVRDAVYSTQPEGVILTIQDVTLLKGASDVQVWAVVTDGQGNVAYVLYPSNQPGVPESTLDLSGYPLQIDSEGENLGLWVLALRHVAYPVAEKMGMEVIAAELASGFARIFAQDTPTDSMLAAVVAQADEELLTWFGEVEILGEGLFSPVQGADEQQADSADGGIRVRYTVNRLTTSINAAMTATPASLYPDSYAGYQKIVDEDFTGNQSSLVWFQERDELYTVLLNEDTYEVALTALGEETDSVISWGSIQQFVFDDYIIRAKLTLLEPGTIASYGLWLHYQNENNFLSFALNYEGEYRIMRYQSRDVVLVNWTADEAINMGGQTNIMEIWVSGEQYTLRVNGQELATVTDDEFADGRIAFYCYAEEVPATCQLDNLELWIPEGAVSPLSTATPE